MSIIRTFRTIGIAFAITAAFGMAPAAAQGAKPRELKFASFNIGTTWYIYAKAIGEMTEKALANGTKVEVLPYQGGVANPMLVNKGGVDLGLSFSALSYWAYKGKLVYKKPNPNIRALVGGLSEPHRLGIVARADLPIKSLGDVKAQKFRLRLATVQLGGAGEALANMALEAYGMKYDDIKSWGGSVNHVDLTVAIDQLRTGQVDMIIHNIGYKTPDFAELAQKTDIKFIALGEKEMKAIVEKYGLEPGLKIEAGEFKGVAADVPSIGYPTGVIASKDLPEETAYVITKTICENKAQLAAAHPSLKVFDPAKAYLPGKNGGIPLHPGARRYYKEKGLM
jgi:TRAP transporter TAXI family solute receptor